MALEAFSEEWALAWCEVLNNRPAYQTAASTWEGAVALVMTRDSSPDSPRRTVFLDLWHGECRAARVASSADMDAAQYVITGSSSAWRDILSGRVAPLTAFLTGKIRLTRGSMGALVPLAGAARELVAAALDMEVTFPEA